MLIIERIINKFKEKANIKKLSTECAIKHNKQAQNFFQKRNRS